jgi:AcrR family transcriptional regulator
VSTRERLTAEAARQFALHGYHGTSIGSLAKALGIQKASIYSHIQEKHDLLAELALAGAAAFREALDAVPADRPAIERLRLALRAHLQVVDTQLEVATIWLQEWRHLAEPARTEFVDGRRRYERRIRTLFEEAIEAGELRADLDVPHAALLFLSVGNWAYTWMTHRTDVDATADAFWMLLLNGARTDAPAHGDGPAPSVHR